MKQIIITIIAWTAIVLNINAQFLFRISGNGLEKPSYMLGTIHFLPDTLLDNIAEYQKAEAQCQQMYVEYIMNSQKAANLLQQVFQQVPQQEKSADKPVEYPTGKNIFDVIDKESADILKAKYKESSNVDLTTPNMEPFRKLPPSYFLRYLSSRLSSQIRRQYWPNGIQDFVISAKAEQRGLHLGQLDDEDIIRQDLFESKPTKPQTLEEQAESLMSFLKRYETIRKEMIQRMKTISNYWMTGDYMSLASDSDVLAEIDQYPRVTKMRNAKWLPKMQTAMKKAPTMFVFGSAHLIGKDGIIQLLRNAGYKVEQVKK